MKYSFKIASVWGIPIELHITFILLMVAVAVLSYPTFYLFILILFLFAFVVLHEMAHTFVARHYNVSVRKIVLYPIGGVSEIEEIPENPSIEWRLAIAGPLTSILIGVILLVLDQFVIIAAPVTPIGASLKTAGSLILDLAVLNLLLGGFNLIPAFPMDGGRVFRAILAERLKFTDATRYAAYIGELFAVGMVVFGIIFPSYFLLIVVGLFVYIGASEEAEQTIVSKTLSQVRVSDVMCTEVATVKPEMTIAEAMEILFKARYHDAIVATDGNYMGVVVWDDIVKVKPEQRNQLRIDQMPIKKFFAYPDESVLEGQKILTRERTSVLPIVDRADPSKLTCVLTLEGISAAFEKAKNPR
ncbi:MAG TPA: site-2 protease family protein [Candidatus Acidoferrales bacterium]|nr:site-2 protease family protein [Candidatus Acidoferrales bacterium]